MRLIGHDQIIANANSGDMGPLRFDPSALADPVAGSSLMAFLVLTNSSARFIQRGWDAESIFWSRYYWFKRFVLLRSRSVGSDPGLEQQVVQLLEHPFPKCEPDWSNLEIIDRAVGE
jgi:hypothetical protein